MTERTGSITDLHATEVESRKSMQQDAAVTKDAAGGDIPAPIINTPKLYDEEKGAIDLASTSSLDGDEPTDEERQTLLHVSDTLPKSAFLVAVVELCERFAYYGLSGPFQNYIENSYHDPSGVPGAIGLGQSGATGLTDFFQFWCYVTPILGGIVADQYVGRYNAIVPVSNESRWVPMGPYSYFSLVYIVGLIVLFCTSLPVAIENGASLGGLIAAMIIIGLGTGGIKSNVSPLIAEQISLTKMKIKTLSNGKRVIVDPAVTIERIYLVFYLCINVGSLSSIATTEMELHIGFWSAYLLPMCMFFVGFGVLLLGKRFYIVRPPQGSIMGKAFRSMWIGAMNKFDMNAAKPSYQEEYGRKYDTPWDDHFIEEMKRALVACRVFVFYPIYWVTYSQMLNNFISQAGQMQLHGVPNDIMQNIDSLTIIIFIPICDRIVYPLLRRIGIPFRPITRITMGFVFATLAMAYAAIVQHLIYSAGPCYDAPLECAASDGGSLPNHVHVAIQTPAYLFIGLSEIFASITGLEYAYTKAPASMKSFIMSMFLLTSAFGSALGCALSPTAVDPKLLWMYTGLAIATFISGIAFWLIYSRYNETEEEMNELEDQGQKAIKATAVDAQGRVGSVSVPKKVEA
ncbi:MAG: peptide transporter ptr2 [Cirrosporium novae-zelandiae]|nr:MAG: peptide transporter ptr2 [Cirrosporium novae-zelandiae]